MFFGLRKTSMRGERRTKWRALLVGVPAMLGLVVLAAAAALAHDTSRETRELRGRLIGNFSTTAPPPLLTLADAVSGNASGLGQVTGSFTVTIDFNRPIANGFVLVSKTGSLVAADGDK